MSEVDRLTVIARWSVQQIEGAAWLIDSADTKNEIIVADFPTPGQAIAIADALNSHEGAVEEIDRLRRLVCACRAYDLNFSVAGPPLHREGCPALPPGGQ